MREHPIFYLRPLREDRRYLEERRCWVFLAALDDLRPLLRRVRLVFLRDLLRDLPPKPDVPGGPDDLGGPGCPYATPNFPVDRSFSLTTAAGRFDCSNVSDEDLITSASALPACWSNGNSGC